MAKSQKVNTDPPDHLDGSPTHQFVDAQVSKDYLLRVTKTFFRIDQILSTITDLKELLSLIMVESKSLVAAESSSLMLYDAQTDELYFEVALGPKGDEVKEIRLRLDQGIAGYAAREGISVNVADASEDKRFLQGVDLKTGYQTRSIVAVPMKRKGKLIGIIEVLNKKDGGSFSDEDVKILEVLAHLAAIAIENARLFEANVRSERMAALGEAIAGMAHCVKNILTGMQGGSSLVEMAITNQKYEILPQAWDILKRSSARVSSLVQNMLTYSKDRVPIRKPTCINRLVQEVCASQTMRAHEEHIALEFEPCHEDLVANVDSQALERCVQNLVVNAIDAIREALAERDLQGHVLVKTRLSADRTEFFIEVSDNGCGIPKEALPRIWQAFYSTKGSSGTGLGLSVTAKIVQEHGGRIDVKSELEKGTTFSIILPAESLE